MKIVHIVDSMDVGGAETLVGHLCRQQRSSGHQPFVHCLLHRGALGEKLESAGVPVSISRLGRWARPADIWNMLRRIRPDVVHCHNAHPTIHAAPLARLAGARMVIATRHGLVPPGVGMIQEKRFWIAARFCDSIVAVCDAAARNLARGPRALPKKILTIRNGTAPAPESAATLLPEKRGFTLITLARLVKPKDQATLLRAVALARPSLPGLAVWILGDGPLRAELEELTRSLALDKCVLFAGERQDTGNWLKAADLFVLTSVSEGLPVSVLEAMAVGLPLLVTNVGGMPEIISLGEGGRVVEPGDPEEIARAVVEMAADLSQLHTWGMKNLALYRAQLTDVAMSDSYLELYRQRAGGS